MAWKRREKVFHGVETFSGRIHGAHGSKAGRAGEAAQILSELRDRVAAAGGASAAPPPAGRTPGGGRLLDVEDMLDRARLWDTLPRP